MQFRFLQYFHKVARLKNFTKAAQELYIAQPALSKQIARLEQEMGTRLFDRLNHGIRLTEEGKLLLLYSEKILGDWWELTQKIREIKRLEHSHLRLAVFPTFLWYIISDLLVDFLKSYQTFYVEIEKGLTEEVIEWVLGHQFEAGVVVFPVSHPRIKEYPLYVEEFGLCVAQGHPWYENDEVPVSELDQYPIIIPTLNRQYYRDFVMALFQQYNIQLEPRLVVHSYEITMKLARSGLGAALIPLIAHINFGEQNERVKLIRINPPLKRQFAWVERRDHKRSPACEAFFQYLTKYIQCKPILTPLALTKN